MRVLFHAVNGVGLGHLVRSACLAKEIRVLEPSARILVLTNARDVSLLEREGIDYVQVPPRLAEPHADPERALRGFPEDLDHAAALAVLETFRPDLAVFDTHAPVPVVRGAGDLGARRALILRELRPAAMRRFWDGVASLEFDRILLPHEPEEIDRARLPTDLPIEVVGSIVRAVPPSVPGARYPDRAPHLVVLAGGGGQPVDAARFLRAAVDAHWLVRAAIPTLETTLLAGPYAPSLAPVPGLTLASPTPDAPALVAGADLVVSQAGYNAVAEIRALQRAAILVPGARRMEDQSVRARRLVRQGAAVLSPAEPRALADRIETLLARHGTRLRRMERAHARRPLIACNREAAERLLRLVRRPRGPVRRVVLVAHDFPPRIGGMETVAREVASGLARQGLNVTVYTTLRVGPSDVPGVNVRRLYTPLRDPLHIDLTRDLLITLAALPQDAPDAIHLCHAGLSSWVPALRAGWPALVSVSLHGNDLLSPWVHAGCAPAVQRSGTEAGLRAADRVLPVSRFSRGLADNAGAAPKRLALTLNAVDPATFAPGIPDADLAAELGIAPDDEVVLTVSRLARRKGHAVVLRALPALLRRRPRVRYVFTGANDSLARELADLSRSLGVASRVTATGLLSAQRIPALMRLARLFVLVPEERDPGDVEGFGVALLEAAATGLPCIASRTGGVPEAVSDGRTGVLVPPGDPEALARELERLLGDPESADRLGRAGRDRVLRDFTWDRTCDSFRSAWDTAEAPPPPDLAALREFAAAPTVSEYPHVHDLRARCASVRHGADLRHLARAEARRLRLDSERRREEFRRAAERGRPLRLRATGDGERLLPAALDDAVGLLHPPEAELRLRRFLDPDFLAHALPRLGGVFLHHSVPAPDPAGVGRRLAALPPETFSKIRSLRLHLSAEARADGRLALSTAPEVHALRSTLSARGIAVAPPPELMRYLSITPAGGPPTAMIEPTNHCNLACPTCPTGTGKIRPLPDLTPDTFDRAIEGLVPGLRNLALWNYGEPTLNRNLPAFIAAAKRRGVGVVKVSSNVHFLNGERGVALLESGLDVLILSVDGASQETYARFRQNGDFSRVAAAVRDLCAEKRRRGLSRPRIELQFIVMKHNEHELPEMRRLAAEWGVDRLRIKTFGAEDDVNRDLVPDDPTLSRYAADRETPNRSHPFCTMPWDHAVINVDGSVTPCCYLRPDMGPQFVMGNVFATPFREIWRGAPYRAFRESMLRDRAAMPVCARCRGGTHDLLAAVEEVKP